MEVTDPRTNESEMLNADWLSGSVGMVWNDTEIKTVMIMCKNRKIKSFIFCIYIFIHII